MARLILAAEADADVRAILDEIGEKAGPRVAERYDAHFDALYSRLETFPEMGARRRKLGPLVRIYVIPPYVPPYVAIYDYTPSDDLVVILRVLHGRRSITRRSLRGPT